MANKFVLIPFEMYRSFLGKSESAQSALDSTLHDPTTSVAEKNILYNKRLRDLMVLRKEAEEKPVKVEITNSAAHSAPEEVKQQPPLAKSPRKRSRAKQQTTPEDVNELLSIISENPAAYGVDSKGRVLNYNGRIVTNSNVIACVKHLLHPLPFATDPPGTTELRTKLSTRATTRRYLFPDSPGTPVTQQGEGFKPKLWTF